tara:strand:- start:403 stop:588 length:186 start_codon:yes stop_codon:yes gene_type:complete
MNQKIQVQLSTNNGKKPTKKSIVDVIKAFINNFELIDFKNLQEMRPSAIYLEKKIKKIILI